MFSAPPGLRGLTGATGNPGEAGANGTGAIPIVSSLPDGSVTSEVHWEVDAVAGILWHMRYRSTLGKWCYIGGAALAADIDTGSDESTASTSYTTLTTAGPVITLPRSGVYEIGLGASLRNSTAGSFTYMSYSVDAAAASDLDAVLLNAGVANQQVPASRFMHRTFAAASVLTAKYKASANTANFNRRWMLVRPVLIDP